jgi:disulfide oxidoreductase YuzD
MLAVLDARCFLTNFTDFEHCSSCVTAPSAVYTFSYVHADIVHATLTLPSSARLV